MVASLTTSAEGALAGVLASLTWGEITTVIGVVATDFGNSINNGQGGNAGVVSAPSGT